MKRIRVLLALSLAAIFLTSGCFGAKTVSTSGGVGEGGGNPATRPGAGVGPPPSGSYNGKLPAGSPWRGLARNLAGQGFSESEIQRFINSPALNYSHKPMETKLRELYGIFYKSETTRAIQEGLFQLGYDITIDGRSGPGTKRVISAFQADQGLSANGAVSEATLAAVNKALKRGAARPLSSYKPPEAKKPSRTSTYDQFTNSSALAQIGRHYSDNKALFQKMSKKFDVPGEVVASIMWIETGFGNYFGKNKAASMLASMAAACDFEVVAPAVNDLAVDSEARAWLAKTSGERGRWALDELCALMRYCNTNGIDPHDPPGSIYGAIGYGQFMPSNAAKFGADGDGDGRVDLFNKADAVFSIGRYLREHGWQGRMPDENKRRAVIMKYNKSGIYVNTVLYVADWLDANAR